MLVLSVAVLRMCEYVFLSSGLDAIRVLESSEAAQDFCDGLPPLLCLDVANLVLDVITALCPVLILSGGRVFFFFHLMSRWRVVRSIVVVCCSGCFQLVASATLHGIVSSTLLLMLSGES